MIDERLRATKDLVAAPVVARLPRAVTPGHLSLAALTCGIGAGLLAAAGSRWWALAAWLVGRALDGLDGALARRSGRQSDLGGYLDLMADTIGYAAVPLGIAYARDDAGTWAACAVLLAAFYVNAMSWTLLSAIAEKRSAGAADRGGRTTVHMPSGLVEGAETIVLSTVMLAVPGTTPVLFWGMAALVALTALQRVGWATRALR